MSNRTNAIPVEDFPEKDFPEVAPERELEEGMVAASESVSAQPAALPRALKVAAALLALLSLGIYVLRVDRVAGLFVDDGWYLMLAQALATGHGYSLTNSPSAGILPLYPPGFPFLLSLLYRLYPHFPENIWLFKAFSMGALLGAGGLVFYYFARVRQVAAPLALALATATWLCPSLVFLATSTVMSEAVFTLNLLATIIVIERAVRAAHQGEKFWKYLLAGAALAAFGFLIRSIAVAVIAAVGVYLLKERLVKPALAFAATVVLLLAPWVIYTRLHAPTPAQRAEQGGHVTLSYSTQFWQKRASVPGLGTIGVSELPARVWWNVQDIVGRDIGRVLATPIFEALIDPFQEAQKEEVKFGISHGSNWYFSFVLSGLVLLGFILAARERLSLVEFVVLFSLGVTALWPWETYRFVLPLVAFIAFYFSLGTSWLVGLFWRSRAKMTPLPQWQLATGLVVLIAAISCAGHAKYIVSLQSASPLDRPQWLQIFDEFEAMLQWVKREVPSDGILATANPPLVYLYTGHKTVALDTPGQNWATWNAVGVRYLVHASIYPEPVDPAETKYKTLYRARSAMSFRVVDLGDPKNRPDWNAPARVARLTAP